MAIPSTRQRWPRRVVQAAPVPTAADLAAYVYTLSYRAEGGHSSLIFPVLAFDAVDAGEMGRLWLTARHEDASKAIHLQTTVNTDPPMDFRLGILESEDADLYWHRQREWARRGNVR